MVEEKEIVEGQEEEILENENLTTIPKTQSMELFRETKIMEMAEMLSKSTIVPTAYQRRPENCFVALDLANRMGLSPLFLMQNLYVIQGKPSFSGQFIASIVQNNPRFKNVELIYVGEEGKDSYGAYVQAESVETGKILKGSTVTISMSKAEAWGAKWKTMSTQMLAYRAFTFFGRVYCPAELMGLSSSEELEDIAKSNVKVENPYEKGDK